MSYSATYYVYKTTATRIKEYRNGHGTASVLWGMIAEKYLGLTRYGYSYPESNLQKLWDGSVATTSPGTSSLNMTKLRKTAMQFKQPRFVLLHSDLGIHRRAPNGSLDLAHLGYLAVPLLCQAKTLLLP